MKPKKRGGVRWGTLLQAQEIGEVYKNFWKEILKWDHSDALAVGGKPVLKSISEKWGMTVSIELNWVKIGWSGGGLVQRVMAIQNIHNAENVRNMTSS
jgi:hypothetical protein